MSEKIKLPTGKEIEVSETNKVSDGFHTFGELYDHRFALFSALSAALPKLAWKSRLHDDGTMWEGWFVCGVNLPSGQVRYHYSMSNWEKLHSKEIANSPAWDGKSDEIKNLLEFAEK